MFPIYLFPAAPFRRRKGPPVAVSTLNASALLPTEHSGAHSDQISTDYLRGQGSLLRCGRCAADLCPTSAIVSRGFTGRWGRAYLVSAPLGMTGVCPSTTIQSLPNTHLHKPVSRQLVTGVHTVSDVSCAFCGNVLGWKYVDAEEEMQRYKVGKFIIETRRVSVATCWEQDDIDFLDPSCDSIPRAGGSVEALEFDSQDEDECEDLFAGMWSRSLALKRRKAKIFGRGLQR